LLEIVGAFYAIGSAPDFADDGEHKPGTCQNDRDDDQKLE
jgi:hypothetical protein